jgi:hypothetical protein
MTLARSAPVAVTVFALAFALTACGSAAPTAPTPTATDVVTPVPTVEPTPELPDLSELVLSPDGLGDGGASDILIGEAPVSTGAASDLLTYSADECAAETPKNPGLWVSTYDDVDEGDGPVAPFAVSVADGLVQYISVNTSQITTVDGLGLGSSLDALLGIYTGGPDEVVDHADISQVYVINGTVGKLMFEVAIDGIDGYWPADKLNTVVGLYVFAIDAEAYGLAGTDAVFGVCSTA